MNAKTMFMKKSSLVIAAAMASLFVSGCASGPEYQRPKTDLPAQFSNADALNFALAPAKEVSAQWWTEFADPVLSKLVEQSLTHNTDILQAVARVEQAEALAQEAKATQLPSLNAGGSAARSKNSSTTSDGVIGNTLRGTASTAFELDFWGKLSRSSEAAQAQTLATRYAREVVRQTIASQVTRSYFSLLTLDRQIVLSRDILQSRDADLRLQQRRLEQGAAGQLDVQQAETLRADAALQLKELERQQALMLSQLALLTGDTQLDLTNRPEALPVLPQLPSTGLPSQLLERRPDVRQAEQQLAAANARIGVADAARFPSISLTGSAGGESNALSNLLSNPSRIWGLGANIDLPIFDGGRRNAVLEQAKAERSAVQAAYQGMVYAAFKDVADALTNLHAAHSSQADAETRERAALAAQSLARKRHDAGYSSYLEVLDAQRTANSAQLQTLSIRQAQLLATVDLYKALGGGWSSMANLEYSSRSATHRKPTR